MTPVNLITVPGNQKGFRKLCCGNLAIAQSAPCNQTGATTVELAI